jgi:holo-[acyl-carrier protein] synthase
MERVFSAGEISYCEKHVKASIHFAARFAAKESFLKALGIGMGMGVRLNDIEVVHDDYSKPDLSLNGEARIQIEKRCITGIHLSLTHTDSYATAIVLLEKN